MKYKKLLAIKSIFLTALFIAAGVPAFSSKNSDIKFKRLSVDEGLSQSTVFAIAQDKKNYMWLGTADGLNRYDGYEFTVFRHISSNPNSIGDNTVSSLLVDNKGVVWIGTLTGLSSFDYQENKFENYSLPNHKIHVFDIVETSDESQLLLATNIGVVVFDKAQKQLEIKSYLTGISVQSLCRFRDGILIGTSNGLYNYSTTYGTIVRVLPQLAKYDISSVIYQPGKGCWIGTYGNGLYFTDLDLQISAHYNIKKSSHMGLGSDNIRVMKCDDSGNLWIGTFDGLFIFDTKEDSFRAYKYHDYDETSISQNSIRSILKDNQGGIWLGTFYGGVNYYHPLAFQFGVMRHSSENSLADNTVSCIVEQRNTGNLWIGTNDNGLNYYDVSKGNFVLYPARSSYPGALQSNNIKCVMPDSDGNLWIGTHGGGLSRMNERTKQIKTYTIRKEIPLSNSCYSLYEKDKNTLWVGTLNGLLTFDKNTESFAKNHLADKNPELAASIIYNLYPDSRSNLWIGTTNNLYLWIPSEDRLRTLDYADKTEENGEGIARVQCINENENGEIWIGTKQGLYKYDYASDTFEHFTVDDGLPNNTIYGILEDGLNRLWISTNYGLSCFDTKTRSFRNYTKDNGISSNQFNIFSYCKTHSGVFYFGGINGITYFRPHDLVDNPFAPNPEISGITIFNREPVTDKKTSLSRDSSGRLISAKFPSSQNLFAVQFVVTNFLAGNRNIFSYKLDGFDNQWYSTRNREATYSNLDPGHYVFHVKAANNNGKWSEQEAVFDIFITPMWYQTILAKVLFFLVAAAIIITLIRFYSSRAKMRVELYLERIQARKKEEINQEKIRFYINLSHELRTPLTLILSPVEEMLQHGIQDKYVRKRLDYIRANSSKLLHIVNQMLDFRKAELGMMKLKVSPTNVENVVANIFALFEEHAQNRDMDYILSSTLRNKSYTADAGYIEIILTNLLSNAFKFTPDGGIVKVSLDDDGKNLIIKVRDSGIGIPPEKQKAIFDRFYQVDDSNYGTGIGLSIIKRLVELHHGTITLDSVPGEYTEFSVYLPSSPKAYDSDETGKDEERRKTKIKDISLFIQEEFPYDQQPKGTGHSDDKEETMLIVEDNEQIKQYLADNYREKFNIYTASDGEEALALLRTIEPDIIITDLMMTGMDGLRFTRSVKQNIRTSHIPIIILTAKDSRDDQIAGIEAGADDYVSKPFSITLLNAKVANLMKTRYRLRNLYSTTAEVDPEKITSNSIDGEFLKKAIKIVEDNMSNEDFSSNDFAKELCMSRSNLHLKIKSITGESSTKFIRKIRFAHACKLLKEGKYSIAEVSAMVGFNSPSYFATSFRKHVGCLPTEYIKNRHGSIKKDTVSEDDLKQ